MVTRNSLLKRLHNTKNNFLICVGLFILMIALITLNVELEILLFTMFVFFVMVIPLRMNSAALQCRHCGDALLLRKGDADMKWVLKELNSDFLITKKILNSIKHYNNPETASEDEIIAALNDTLQTFDPFADLENDKMRHIPHLKALLRKTDNPTILSLNDRIALNKKILYRLIPLTLSNSRCDYVFPSYSVRSIIAQNKCPKCNRPLFPREGDNEDLLSAPAEMPKSNSLRKPFSRGAQLVISYCLLTFTLLTVMYIHNVNLLAQNPEQKIEAMKTAYLQKQNINTIDDYDKHLKTRNNPYTVVYGGLMLLLPLIFMSSEKRGWYSFFIIMGLSFLNKSKIISFFDYMILFTAFVYFMIKVKEKPERPPIMPGASLLLPLTIITGVMAVVVMPFKETYKSSALIIGSQYALAFLFILISFMYFSHISNNNKVPYKHKYLWPLYFFILGQLSMIYYYFKYIAPDLKPHAGEK